MESKTLYAVLLMIIMTLMTALGQILLKIGVSDKDKPGDILSLIVFFWDIRIIGGFLLAITAPLVYLKALSYLPLGEIYGLNGLSYFFVFLLSRLIFKEKGNRYHWAGLFLITTGIVIWAGGGLLG